MGLFKSISERIKKERYSSVFEDKLTGLIRFASGWFYPAKKSSVSPEFDRSALYNINPFSRSSALNSPNTSISTTNEAQDVLYADTIKIDDFVSENDISKIDFIKTDIEGSKIPALNGAAETIRQFKPKLAICGYHKADDLWTIPQRIKSLVPEYRLYLDHHTCMNNETVIYAIV